MDRTKEEVMCTQPCAITDKTPDTTPQIASSFEVKFGTLNFPDEVRILANALALRFLVRSLARSLRLDPTSG